MKSTPSSHDMEQRLIETLRAKGYKLTAPRREIIRVLSREFTHPGAMDILRKVRKKTPQVSLSTVYYTLDMLKREGLIQELEFYNQDNRYDVNMSNHINLICKKCGRIEDFPGKLPYSYAQVRQKSDFEPLGMRYEYYGLCKACRRKGAG